MSEEIPNVLLETAVRNQDDLERDIGRQADQMLTEQADERDKKRLEKTQLEITRLTARIRQLRARLSQPANSNVKNKIRSDIADLEVKLQYAGTELAQIQARIEKRHQGTVEVPELDTGSSEPLSNESRRDFLIRTGKITPFSKIAQIPRVSASLNDVMLDAEAGDEEDMIADETADTTTATLVSHRNLLRPGFQEDSDQNAGDEGDFIPEDIDDVEEDSDAYVVVAGSRKRKHAGKYPSKSEEVEDLAGVDDGNEKLYQIRLQKWATARKAARDRARGETTDQNGDEGGIGREDEVATDDEWHQPHPTRADADLGDGYKVPGDIYPSLFDYQKTGVQWLSELFSQQVGGIVGDEMGLGKTIQIISFVAGLHYSKKLTKPVIIVAPATVMKQWVNEFHQWWPALRVSILHTSGSGMMDVRKESQMERDLEDDRYRGSTKRPTKAQKAAKKIVDRVVNEGHVLVTTYTGLLTYAELLVPVRWEYAVLDEGHKIRNPETTVAYHCKTLQTHNRIILSGTPMQNNLTELWSLFDFVFPMRLGTLPSFRLQFEHPIKQGGYANASNLQVETAMKCAETLKETISPYLLQRFKIDVAADLPKKSERVLFCKLTKMQRDAYELFLKSDDMKSILAGRRQALYGVDILRKISNHPDLVDHKTLPQKIGYDYGSGAKSGKMQVVKALLEMWKKNGHKTLLFSQQRIMLDILQKFVKNMDGVNFLRMDGTTDVKDRQPMVDKFNNDPDLHVFLLTTKVGGLGVNLTGADRVIIFDPDWNPSTDVQARERAWRLGQKREVEIYRLMTAGTIEEKIYHRQIFKQFLTNKILKDPKQRQTFQLRDLHDLFTLGDEQPEGQTETSNLFKGTEVRFKDKQEETVRGILNPPIETDTAQQATHPSNVGRILAVARQEDFQTGESSRSTLDAVSEAADAEQKLANDPKDERLLSTIFSRSGVHSALEHDAIIESGAINRRKKVKADPEVITKEAKRIAAEAAEELRRAAEVARTVPIGTPTWTGTIGDAGRPADPRRRGRGGLGGGPGSSSILSNLAARHSTFAGANDSSGTNRHGSLTRDQNKPRGRAFIKLIRDYIVTHGGSVYTQNLIDHFGRYCSTESETAEFKEMLRLIATLQRGSRGRGRWVLKDEYKGTARVG